MANKNEDIDGTLIVDIDGTLCDIKSESQSYDELCPRQDILEKLTEYQRKGYRILLFTSRNMKTHDGNLGLINKHTAPILLNWLARWKVPYDEILFGKPWPRKYGFYIDDRAIRPNEFISMTESEIHQLLSSK
jgi:capsule biosynthesis phosphatase